MNDNYFIILDEQEGHPYSVLTTLTKNLEKQSILYISNAKQLEAIKTKPIFSVKYLVIFQSFYAMKNSLDAIKFNFMVPVYRMNYGEHEEIQYLLKQKKIPFKIVSNSFTAVHANEFLLHNANTKLSEYKTDLILKKFGTSPSKLINAVNMLNTMGYSVKNINSITQRYSYVSAFDLVLFMLHASLSKKKYQSIVNYLYSYRFVFHSIKEDMLVELEVLLMIFNDIMNGKPQKEGVTEYIQNTKELTAYKYWQIINLFDTVSIVTILRMQQFLRKTDLMTFLTIIGGDIE